MEPEIIKDTPAISKHGLDKVDISPLDYWWHYRRPGRDPWTPDKDTAFDMALRAAVLDPREFAKTYVRTPEISRRSNDGKAEYASLLALAERNSQILLTPSEYDDIKRMVDAILKHKTTKLLVTDGIVGNPTVFEEVNTGAPIKLRPHWIHSSGIIIHLTSAKDASTNKFQKEAWELRHDKRAALQMDGMGLDGVAFITIEKTEPFKISIHHLDPRSIAFGRETYVRNCETYLKCLETDIWPGFTETIQPVSLPEYAFRQ